MNPLLLELFYRFIQIGLLSIGGGYATIPLIQEQVVQATHWLTAQEFTDIITISQMTPGPLAVNTSTFTGLQIAGLPGAAAATLGCILPGFFISLLLYCFFQKHRKNNYVFRLLQGLKAVSVGLITASAASILMIAFFGSTDFDFTITSFNLKAGIIFCFGLLLLRKFKTNPFFVMLLSGSAGFILYINQ